MFKHLFLEEKPQDTNESSQVQTLNLWLSTSKIMSQIVLQKKIRSKLKVFLFKLCNYFSDSSLKCLQSTSTELYVNPFSFCLKYSVAIYYLLWWHCLKGKMSNVTDVGRIQKEPEQVVHLQAQYWTDLNTAFDLFCTLTGNPGDLISFFAQNSQQNFII